MYDLQHHWKDGWHSVVPFERIEAAIATAQRCSRLSAAWRVVDPCGKTQWSDLATQWHEVAIPVDNHQAYLFARITETGEVETRLPRIIGSAGLIGVIRRDLKPEEIEFIRKEVEGIEHRSPRLVA